MAFGIDAGPESIGKTPIVPDEYLGDNRDKHEFAKHERWTHIGNKNFVLQCEEMAWILSSARGLRYKSSLSVLIISELQNFAV
jgi:hypothetical protein